MKTILLAGALVLGVFSMEVHADQPAMNAQSADCTTMSMAEQQFSAQLNASNKALFCGKFSSAQRAKAMQAAGQLDASGNAMTADAAVQKVSQEMNAAPASTAPKASGACPVK